MKGHPIISSILLLIPLTGCGTYVPQLHEAWEDADTNDPLLVQRIKQSIFCELRQAVIAEKDQIYEVNGVSQPAIPDDWGAQMTISLQVDETGALNPGVTYTTPFWATHTFTLGAGGTLSSQATRIDKYYSFFALKYLKPEIVRGDTTCMEYDHGKPVALDRHGSSYLLSGNLGIDAWLKGALISQNALPSSKLPKSLAQKGDVLSYDVKFIVITSVNASPTWRFVKLTAGSNTPFLSSNRTRTHELLLTLGPSVDTTTVINGQKRIVPSPNEAAYSVHFASEIGQSVAAALRGAATGVALPIPVQ